MTDRVDCANPWHNVIHSVGSTCPACGHATRNRRPGVTGIEAEDLPDAWEMDDADREAELIAERDVAYAAVNESIQTHQKNVERLMRAVATLQAYKNGDDNVKVEGS
jgi:hypothetical protein